MALGEDLGHLRANVRAPPPPFPYAPSFENGKDPFGAFAFHPHRPQPNANKLCQTALSRADRPGNQHLALLVFIFQNLSDVFLCFFKARRIMKPPLASVR